MLDLTKDIQIPNHFRRQSGHFLKQLKKAPRDTYSEREGSSHRSGRQSLSAPTRYRRAPMKTKLSVRVLMM